MQNIVSEHEQYLDALRDFNDWLTSAKEELQRWSDLSGDSFSIKRKLSKVQVKNFPSPYNVVNIYNPNLNTHLCTKRFRTLRLHLVLIVPRNLF